MMHCRNTFQMFSMVPFRVLSDFAHYIVITFNVSCW